MIRKVLIANRGEIAVRIARTCRRLGIATATVHSSADRFSRHVREIGESFELGPPPAGESYLRVDVVIRAALELGADAIHPGYGFLSENAAAAQAVEDAGLIWLGPRPETIEQFGDKSKAKQLAVEAGVPVIPGVDGAFKDPAALTDAVKQIGLPVLLKAVAGGGGRGMRLVDSLDDLEQSVSIAMSEAERSFGAPDLMVERYLVDARHIEVQIAGDGRGKVIHLYERECSLQRRHQKIIEEAPAASLSDDLRQRILQAACSLGEKVLYRSIGTVELIVSGEEFFFLEVNPRIQVEHPVTEQITGIDLVELQLRIAMQANLGIDQADVKQTGYAFEARIYAEDPMQGYLPMVGKVEELSLPESADKLSQDSMDSGFRAECSVDRGDYVTSHYDPMILKLIAWGPDRRLALEKMTVGLDSSHIGGVTTNLAFLRALVSNASVINGDYHTKFVEDSFQAENSDLSDETVAMAAALWLRGQRTNGESGPWTSWQSTASWRLATAEPTVNGAPVAVLSSENREWQLRDFPALDSGFKRLAIDDSYFDVALFDTGEHNCVASVGERTLALSYRIDEQAVFVSTSGFEATLEVSPYLSIHESGSAASANDLAAPMTGQVLRVLVETGDQVEKGDVIVVMESMKLELEMKAQQAGTVAAVHCAPGTVIERGTAVAEIDTSTNSDK